MQTVMAASDSETDEIDENAIHDVEAGADLLESVYIYITEGIYQEGLSAKVHMHYSLAIHVMQIFSYHHDICMHGVTY